MTRRTKLFGWTVSLGLIASAALAVDIEKIEGEVTWDGSDPVPKASMLEVDLIALSRDGCFWTVDGGEEGEVGNRPVCLNPNASKQLHKVTQHIARCVIFK